MGNNNKVGNISIYGDIPTTTQNFVRKFRKEKMNPKILVVDCKDGQILKCFAYAGYDVTGYEPNIKYLDGGIFRTLDKNKIIDRKIIGLRNILKNYNNVKLINKNFYNTEINDKYDFIYVHKSLHRYCNSNITMKNKINKLLSCLKKDGYLYIYYHIRENDNIEKYPINQYLDKGEILKYFNKEIIYLGEGYNVSNKAHYNRLYDHTHKIGYIIIQNKEKQIKESVYSNYEIVIGKNN